MGCVLSNVERATPNAKGIQAEMRFTIKGVGVLHVMYLQCNNT